MARYLITASSEFEASAIRGRLREAGIQALEQGEGAFDERRAFAHSRDIYVDDHDLERAKTALRDSEGFDEDELARLSEEAYRKVVDAELMADKPPQTTTPQGPLEPRL